ncbi:unnamed protein product [Rotaria socialis]
MIQGCARGRAVAIKQFNVVYDSDIRMKDQYNITKFFYLCASFPDAKTEDSVVSNQDIKDLHEEQPQTVSNAQKKCSRFEIENEIINMLQSILQFDKKFLCQAELLYIGYAHAHLDILFEQLNCAKQSIGIYLQHNHRIYNTGFEMKYIVQAYFIPRHFNEEDWRETYSKYLEHPAIYGKCGLHPLFADHYNLSMELNLRRCLSHKKVKAVGEIGLDYYNNIFIMIISASAPSKDIQIEAFHNQVLLAREKNLPLIIYSRSSFIDIMKILCKELPVDNQIAWRNFEYENAELNMLNSKFNSVFMTCSPHIFNNLRMKQIIQATKISSILPESVCPNLTVRECPNVWRTHPVFVAPVYNFIAELYGLSIEETSKQLVNNIQRFFNLS